MLTELPATILLDIIQYLSPIDCYRSMYGINETLDGIIRYGTTHINLSNIELRRDFDYYLDHILPNIIISLRSLKISNDFLFDKEHEFIYENERAIMFGIIKKVHAKIDLVAYKKLEELILENVNGAQLNLISTKLINIPQLKRLVITFYGKTADCSTSIFNNDIIRSKLKKLRLILIDANVNFPSISLQNILPHLDYLKVDSCIAGNVAILLFLVQNIKYLNISIWNFPNQSQTFSTNNLKFPNLTYLKLKVDEIKWDFVKSLLQQCGERLQHLTFLATGNLDLTNADDWKQLISNYLKQLIKFNFRITVWETSLNDINLKSFNTDFWHKLNVYVACDWTDNSSEEEGDLVDIYTLPFSQSYFYTVISSVNILSAFINPSYKRIRTLNIIMNEKSLSNTKRIYEKVNSIIISSYVRHNNNIFPFLDVSIDCNNINHIGFFTVCAQLKPQVFCQLLQTCPNLYSLKLHSKILIEMTNRFTDEKTCLLLNKLIKHIQFNNNLGQEDFDEQTTKKFIQTFNNLERIYIHMELPDDILKNLFIIIQHMKMLNKIFIQTPQNIPNGFIDQMKETIFDLKECYIRKEKSYLFIWR